MRATSRRSALAPAAGVGIALLAIGAGGCEAIDGVCTAAGCQDSVSVFVDAADLEPGDWRFALAAGATEPLYCEVPVPATSWEDVWCSDRRFAVILPRDDRPDSWELRFTPNYGAGEPSQDAPPPSAIALTAWRDGELVTKKTIEPGYEDFRPNGPDCTPVCQVASLDIEL
jgi:hypothetical protein